MDVRIDSALYETQCLGEADLRQVRQVVTAREDTHVSELVQREAAGSYSHRQVQSLLLHQQSIPIHVKLENHLSHNTSGFNY